MQAAVDRTAAAGIPHDAQWGDIDIMDRELDFTISPERFGGLSEYVLELKSRGIKFITILARFGWLNIFNGIENLIFNFAL